LTNVNFKEKLLEITGNSNGSEGKGKLSPPHKAAAALGSIGGTSHAGLQVDTIPVLFTPPVFPPGGFCFRRFRGNFSSSLHF